MKRFGKVGNGKNRTRKLGIESLEARTLLAVTAGLVQADFLAGDAALAADEAPAVCTAETEITLRSTNVHYFDPAAPETTYTVDLYGVQAGDVVKYSYIDEDTSQAVVDSTTAPQFKKIGPHEVKVTVTRGGSQVFKGNELIKICKPMTNVINTSSDVYDPYDYDGGTVTVSLREALEYSYYGGVTDIYFDSSLAKATITLGNPCKSVEGNVAPLYVFANQKLALHGTTDQGDELSITLSIDNESNVSRFINIMPGAEVTIDSLAFSGGCYEGNGGAILNQGTLTLNLVTISGAESTGDGGAVYSTGELIVKGSRFEGCSANGNGGAVYMTARANLKIDGTGFIGCVAEGNGGAVMTGTNAAAVITGDTYFSECLANYGGAVMTGGESTLEMTGASLAGGNAVKSGSALYIWGGVKATVTDSYVSGNGNTAIDVYGGDLTLTNTVVSDGVVYQGGTVCGIYSSRAASKVTGYNLTIANNNIGVNAAKGAVKLYNSIVVNNTTDVTGTCLSGDYNLSSVSFGTNFVKYDKSPLFDTADPQERKYYPLFGSQAINAGNSSYVTAETDLSGDPRVVSTAVDFGAYELQGPIVSGITVTGWSGPFDGNSHTVTVSGAEATDTIVYTYDGNDYAKAPSFTLPGCYTVYVTVSRAGYLDWFGSADVLITEPGTATKVTTLLDVIDPNDGVVSLREAVAAAGDGDTVTFSETLANGTITLKLGAIEFLTDGVAVDGGTCNITVSGNDASQIFSLKANDITVSNLTLTNGAGKNGGAVYVEGKGVLFTDLTIKDSAAEYGAGIFAAKESALEVANSVISGNAASNSGGGFYAWNKSSVTMTDVKVVSNSAVVKGAGLCFYAAAGAELTNLQITENIGDGISVSGKSVNKGAAVLGYNLTVADNTAAGVSRVEGGATTALYNSIVLKNKTDVSGTVVGAKNLSSKAFGTQCLIYLKTRPLFKTGTYELAAGCQGIDVGLNQYVFVDTDLAGNTRIVNKKVDLGAYEVQAIAAELADAAAELFDAEADFDLF